MTKSLPWHENIEFPEVCDYCMYGCQCGSPMGISADDVKEGLSAERCKYCKYGCDCEDECNCECRCCECYCECESFIVEAKSYNHWIKKQCYVCPPNCLTSKILKKGTPWDEFCVTPVDEKFNFLVRVLPTKVKQPVGLFIPTGFKTVETKLQIAEGNIKSEVKFDGPVFIPQLAEKLNTGKSRVWMSLTPMEIFTQRRALKKARGKVLIGGLGMGWLTKRVLEQPGVAHVTQLEINPSIAKFFGEPLLQMFPGRLEVKVADVWDFLSMVEPLTFDTILLDIWPVYVGAAKDKNFWSLKRLHPNVWGWGEDSV